MMACLAPVSARNLGNGHEGLGGLELSQNCYLIIITELWPGDLPGWSPSLVSSFFGRDWLGSWGTACSGGGGQPEAALPEGSG